uniref:Serine aminopeptidase S33 domain-containing protein n=1 Tax=Alexandrium monilatum TaxID=311494 RepID=A0A7S4VU87_9DINO
MFDFDDMPPPQTPLGTAVGEEEEELWTLAGGADDSKLPAAAEPRLGVAVAHLQPRPQGRAPLGALLVPGMPQKVYGSSRMTDPLFNAIVRRCWSLGLPTVRFDYSGCGRSAGQEPDLGSGVTVMQREASAMLQRVLEHCCEKVVVIAYSAGNNAIIHELHRAHTTYASGRVAAYVNLSMGTRASALVREDAAAALGSKDPDLTLLPPEVLEMNDELDVPSLFLVGQQDLMTPAVDILAITQRKSRKSPAEMQVLQGKHAFNRVEERPADAIKAFLLRTLAPSAAA